MTANRRAKNARMRGSHTHGWGSKKKHRGAGNRGGKGMAGTGKRGDAKKPEIWKSRYFGKKGFKRNTGEKPVNPITIKTLIQELPLLVKKGFATESNGAYEIDLLKIKCNKLLSQGNATEKINIKVDNASAKAVEKITDAGGSVKIIGAPQESKKEE